MRMDRFFLCGAALFAGTCFGAELYVSPSGNDKNQEHISVSLSDATKKAKVDALVPRFSVSLWYRLASSVEDNIKWDYLIGRKREENRAGV